MDPKWQPKWPMDHPRRPPEAVRGPTLERLVARAASRGGLGAPRGSVSTPPGQTYPFLVLKGPFGDPKSVKILKKKRHQKSRNRYQKNMQTGKYRGAESVGRGAPRYRTGPRRWNFWPSRLRSARSKVGAVRCAWRLGGEGGQAELARTRAMHAASAPQGDIFCPHPPPLKLHSYRTQKTKRNQTS